MLFACMIIAIILEFYIWLVFFNSSREYKNMFLHKNLWCNFVFSNIMVGILLLQNAILVPEMLVNRITRKPCAWQKIISFFCRSICQLFSTPIMDKLIALMESWKFDFRIENALQGNDSQWIFLTRQILIFLWATTQGNSAREIFLSCNFSAILSLSGFVCRFTIRNNFPDGFSLYP